MRNLIFSRSACALILLGFAIADAKHSHEHLVALEKRHRAHHHTHQSKAERGESAIGLAAPAASPIEKRDGQCQFPYNAGLVPVTPGSSNAGWAMSPDQPCTPGHYCPYACPSGQVSMQWNPDATSYSYPASMDGGLYCDSDGNMQKPFPDKPYCQDGAPGLGVKNEAGGVVAICQTVLPGNEAMLIPTSVEDFATLAVPQMSYWLNTAAQYVNSLERI